MKFLNVLVLVLTTLFLNSCKEADKTANRDTPTKGKIHIAVDETYKTMVDSEITVFKSEYKDVEITVDYVPEAYAVQQLLADSARAIVIGRELNEKELSKYKARKYDPKSIRIATDAIAVIANPKNKTDVLDLVQLKDILSGKLTTWPDGKNIEVVIDNPGSGIINFLQDSVLKDTPIAKSIFALKNQQEVLEYVGSHEKSIGFIGVNLISSFDADANQQFLASIKPMGISKGAFDKAYKPYQAYVASRNYPLLRFTTLIVDEAYNGLGSGFATFVGSDKGQRIILKDGLVPANSPIRLIEVNTN